MPYEDVQTAATSIAQCTTNVLTVSVTLIWLLHVQSGDTDERLPSFQAVNGPLQQRTSTLDLDSTRANALPDDYDTDLESPWGNPSRFLHLWFLANIAHILECI